MSEHVTLKIDKIRQEEIPHLQTAISAMSELRFQDFRIQLQTPQHYVLSLKTADLADISTVVECLRRVVAPDRIALSWR